MREREEDGVEEKKENRPSKGGRSQIGCDPQLKCSWDHVIRNVPKNDLLSLLHQN